MKDLRVKDLLDLVSAGVPDPEGRIQQIFEWHFQRVHTLSQWTLGIAATLAISLLASLFVGENHAQWWYYLTGFLGVLAIAGYGAYRLWELRRLHGQFVAALKLLAEFQKMRSFVALYRGKSAEA